MYDTAAYAYDDTGNTLENGCDYRARYYDPMSGRFISEDPIVFDGDGTNLFVYVENSPLTNMDPTGLALCTYFIDNGGGRMGLLVCVPDDPKNGGTLMTPAASGNNGGGTRCKNNTACADQPGRGPIPPGWWRWNGVRGKHGGRLLVPLPGNKTTRTGIMSHFCQNPFGPALKPPFCSEGCITASPADIRMLNRLLDAEPNSDLFVEGSEGGGN